MPIVSMHSLVCKRASGKITKHQALNDVIARAFVAADIPLTKEPNGLSISDNKIPDGLTVISLSSSAVSFGQCAQLIYYPVHGI